MKVKAAVRTRRAGAPLEFATVDLDGPQPRAKVLVEIFPLKATGYATRRTNALGQKDPKGCSRRGRFLGPPRAFGMVVGRAA